MRELTFTDAAREGLSEEMARDPSVFVVGEGIGARGGNFNTTTVASCSIGLVPSSAAQIDSADGRARETLL